MKRNTHIVRFHKGKGALESWLCENQLIDIHWIQYGCHVTGGQSYVNTFLRRFQYDDYADLVEVVVYSTCESFQVMCV